MLKVKYYEILYHDLLKDKYIKEDMGIKTYLNMSTRIEKVFVIINAKCISENKQPFIKGKIHYFDRKVYIPYLSDFLRVDNYHKTFYKKTLFNKIDDHHNLFTSFMNQSHTTLDEDYNIALRVLKNNNLVINRRCSYYYRLKARIRRYFYKHPFISFFMFCMFFTLPLTIYLFTPYVYLSGMIDILPKGGEERMLYLISVMNRFLIVYIIFIIFRLFPTKFEKSLSKLK